MNQNTNKLLTLCLTTFLAMSAAGAASFGTSFTYQGRLASAGNPASGVYDFNFSLYDSAGISVAPTQTVSSVSITNGIFTVGLDFGSAPFNGDARLLQVAVRTNGGASFTALSPRQPLTPAPYSLSASNVLGPVPAAQLTGVLPSGQLSGVYSGALTLNNAGNTLFGNGASLSNVNAQTLGGLGAANFWKIAGNAGTVAGINFLGTTDNQPLEIKVNGQRAFRLEPTTNAPNVIGGSSNNVSTNATGATIAGGGQNVISGGGNAVVYSSVSGGFGNLIQGSQSSIAGGFSNSIFSDGVSIAGGSQNTIILGSSGSAIGGGTGNYVAGYGTDFSTISGGQQNFIGDAWGGAIGGGTSNTITFQTSQATISGGQNNRIEGAGYATISGGQGNQIYAPGGFIGGGLSNVIEGADLGPKAFYSTIGGGKNNSIDFLGEGGTIAGGASNFIGGFGYQFQGTVGGGLGNVVGNRFGTVPGGAQASASRYGQMAYASGQFASSGDAQTSTYVSRAITTNAIQTELFLDGQVERMLVPTNSTWSFDILITGKTASGSSAVFNIRGGIKNVAGTTSLIGATDIFTRKDVAGYDAVAVADDVNDALVVKVIGAAGTTIRWVASVRTVEVTF